VHTGLRGFRSQATQNGRLCEGTIRWALESNPCLCASQPHVSRYKSCAYANGDAVWPGTAWRKLPLHGSCVMAATEGRPRPDLSRRTTCQPVQLLRQCCSACSPAAAARHSPGPTLQQYTRAGGWARSPRSPPGVLLGSRRRDAEGDAHRLPRRRHHGHSHGDPPSPSSDSGTTTWHVKAA